MNTVIRLVTVFLLMVNLIGCSSQPTVVTEIVRTPTWIPYPVTLVQPISADLGPNPTWGSAVGTLSAAVQTCEARLDAIRTLAPPPVTKPINP